MRAFIAGATGYTGRELVCVLREADHDVTAHVRPDSRALPRWRAHFGALGARLDTTPWEGEALASTLARVEPTHVFALLGTTRRRMRADGEERNTYEAVDYGLTSLLLRATRAASPRARFVYLSSVGASERGSAYLRARGRIERELRESGLSWITARPAFVTGADREEARPAELIAGRTVDAFLRALALVGVRGPARRYGSLSGAALARALAALAEDAHDGVYDAAALRAAAEQLSGR